MGDFAAVALSFPTVLFTFALVVVVGYWLLYLVGGVGLDLFDGDMDGSDTPGWLKGLDLGGVPATVGITFFVCLAWLASLTGTVLADAAGLTGAPLAAVLAGVLAAAVAAAYLGTRVLTTPLRHFFHTTPAPSRADFVGTVCTVRTGTVGPGFGQAEVRSRDGSTALVQVRQTAQHVAEQPLRSGDPALIYDYDADGEFFWVCPVDPALGDLTT